MNGAAGATPFDVLVAKIPVTQEQADLAKQRITRKAQSACEAAMFLAALKPEVYEPPNAEDVARAAKPRWER